MPETVVAVDVADLKLLGNMWERFEGRIDLNIDHHVSNTHYAKRLYLDETASATAESVFEILDELGVEFDRDIATTATCVCGHEKDIFNLNTNAFHKLC